MKKLPANWLITLAITAPALRKALTTMWGDENPSFGPVCTDFVGHRQPEAFGGRMPRIDENPHIIILTL